MRSTRSRSSIRNRTTSLMTSRTSWRPTIVACAHAYRFQAKASLMKSHVLILLIRSSTTTIRILSLTNQRTTSTSILRCMCSPATCHQDCKTSSYTIGKTICSTVSKWSLSPTLPTTGSMQMTGTAPTKIYMIKTLLIDQSRSTINTVNPIRQLHSGLKYFGAAVSITQPIPQKHPEY